MLLCSKKIPPVNHDLSLIILIFLSHIYSAGGPWLITDMRRGECIFDLDPNLKEQLEIGIEMDGSNLSGVNCKVEWSEGSNLCNESHVNNNCKEYDKENRTNNKITDYGEYISIVLLS